MKLIIRLCALIMMLITVVCFTACGTMSVNDLNKNAENIYNAAEKALNSIENDGISVYGNYIIASDPNYNFYQNADDIEKNVFDLYKNISSYYPDADNCEYIFEVNSGLTGTYITQIYTAEKWDSKAIGGYPTASGESGKCIYLPSSFETLQDIADQAGTLNTSFDPYSVLEGDTAGEKNSYGLNLSSFEYYDILDALIQFCGNYGLAAFGIIFVVSLMWCLFGYKVFQIFAALASLLMCVLIGLLLTAVIDGTAFWVMFIVGIILAFICAKSRKFSAFIIGIANVFPIFYLLMLILLKDYTRAGIIAAVISIIVAIFTAIFDKPLVIITSSIGYGALAGTSLACMIPKTRLSIIFQIIFIFLGLFVQTKICGGLLESGPLLARSKKKTDSDTLSKEVKYNKKKRVSDYPYESVSHVSTETTSTPATTSAELASEEKKVTDEPATVHSSTPKTDDSSHKLSIGSTVSSLVERPSSRMVIKVDKNEKNTTSTGNSHFSAADDFDD